MNDKDNSRLQNASGYVQIKSRLVGFLYDLMRDHLPPGVVEKLAIEASNPYVVYSNGWLARYAEDVAIRLSPMSHGHRTSSYWQDKAEEIVDSFCKKYSDDSLIREHIRRIALPMVTAAFKKAYMDGRIDGLSEASTQASSQEITNEDQR